MMGSKTKSLEAKLEQLEQRVADLENPLKFSIGDSITASGKTISTCDIRYQGEIVSTKWEYRDSEEGMMRVNYVEVYNRVSKTVHMISDLHFKFEPLVSSRAAGK